MENNGKISTMMALFKRGADLAKTALDTSTSQPSTYSNPATITTPTPQAAESLFSTSLSSSLNRSNKILNRKDRVPYIALECMAFIAEKGREEVGIYRLSGSTRQVAALRELADREGRAGFDEFVDANAVASLFKAWVRELPECLLGNGVSSFQQLFSGYTDIETYFSDTITLEDKHHVLLHNESILSRLEALIQQWCSEEARDLLAHLMAHLRDISKNEAKNKMGLNNLQVVWSPTLRFGGAVFMMFVLHHERLFPIISDPCPYPDVLPTTASTPPPLNETTKPPALPPRSGSTRLLAGSSKPLPKPPTEELLPIVRGELKSPLSTEELLPIVHSDSEGLGLDFSVFGLD